MAEDDSENENSEDSSEDTEDGKSSGEADELDVLPENVKRENTSITANYQVESVGGDIDRVELADEDIEELIDDIKNDDEADEDE